VSGSTSVAPNDRVALYRAMRRARAVDLAATELCQAGTISSHVGALGEEAAVIGSAFALSTVDWAFPSFRDLGGALLRGMSVRGYADHLLGNADDGCVGRQMPDHWSYRAGKLASVSSLGGTHIPHAVGFAWAAKLRGDPLAVLVSFGDAATSAGGFHNGMNFAGVFKPPAVLFCKSSGWAGTTPSATQTASDSIAAKGIAYDVPAVRCDGNDVLAVAEVTRAAMERARSGGGPTLIEAVIVRADAGAVEATETLDPVRRLLSHLVAHDLWSDAQEHALQAELDAEVAAAFDAATATAPPALDTMFRDVYANVPDRLQDQERELEITRPRR
jgi:2-oxoisovalerate dehydrogenase E1 component alpha subunit